MPVILNKVLSFGSGDSIFRENRDCSGLLEWF